MYTSQSFLGAWDVIRHERRIHGKWVHKHNFALGEWMTFFFGEGRHTNIFHMAGMSEQITTFDWTFDPRSGIISLHPDETSPETIRTLVFVETKNGGWLYFYDDEPHIVTDRRAIIARHSHERWQLVRGRVYQRDSTASGK